MRVQINIRCCILMKKLLRLVNLRSITRNRVAPAGSGSTSSEILQYILENRIAHLVEKMGSKQATVHDLTILSSPVHGRRLV